MGYASDVCDYNVVDIAKSKPSTSVGGRGFLIQPADIQLSNSQKHDSSYIQQKMPNSLVSSYVKPMSPSIESSLYDRRQKLIQKRAKIFQSTENLSQSPKPYQYRSITPNYCTTAPITSTVGTQRATSVHNLTEHFEQPPLYFDVQSSSKPFYKAPACFNNDITAIACNTKLNANALLQARTANFERPVQDVQQNSSNHLGFNNDVVRKVSQESTTADEDMANTKPLRRKGTSTGVRAKIARRKKMKDANALDNVHGSSLSDQEATSEAYDEDDSVEEKQDNESMNDWQSLKPKSPSQPAQEISNHFLTPEMTPETARKNWNSRFSNIKHSFNAASEEDLSNKSWSPSIHKPEGGVVERGRLQTKESPLRSVSSGSSSPSFHRMERPQSKEDKDKENILKASTPQSVVPSVPQITTVVPKKDLPKSKQPTPNRENLLVASARATKSMPRDTSYDENSRAEVMGLVKAGRGEVGGNGAKSQDMDYQEYMNIISRVRKTKEFSRVRAEHYRLASMYAKEQKRQEELELEEERLKNERQKIEAEARTRPQPLPIMPVYPMVHHRPKESQPPVEQVKPPQQPPQQPPPDVAVYNSASNGTLEIRTDQSLSNNASLHSSQQSLGEEKGQLDKIQTEQQKHSPSPVKSILKASPISQQLLPATPVVPQQMAVTPFEEMKNTPDNVEVVHPKPPIEDIEEEHKRQQEIKESLIREEQEKLQKLIEEQMKQEKEREEIRRLEHERLRQIQEEQRQLEDERRRQEENIRLEQLRIEEERRRQERLQTEKNAEYNRQRLEMEAKTVAMNEGQRAVFDPRLSTMSPQEKLLQERLLQQERLRAEHRKEESQIRQEKLKLIQEEEVLISRQEDMLQQIEAERQNLAKQEELIRKRQKERLHQVRQEKLLLEKQEEMIRIREEQLEQERKRQEKLREEQRALKEQEEAIRKRQEQISKELMSANIMQTSGDILSDALFSTQSDDSNLPSHSNGAGQELQLGGGSDSLEHQGDEQDAEDGEVWSGSGSGSETLDEDAGYECKVEVKQAHTLVPKTVRTIESSFDNPAWAPVTPYLTYTESQTVQAQEEIKAIFSQSKFTRPGVITSPESMRTSTNLITTPETSLSLQSQLSVEPRSLSSSCANSPPHHVPQLPFDDQPISSKPVASLDIPSPTGTEGKSGPSSPRIGGPGSAFKPYASSENLFDPTNFPKRSNTEGSIPNGPPTKNFPLHNGNGMDSRFFMKGGRGINPKIRELKKPVRPPFSTTDTEPEMKECNLTALDKRRRGKQNLPVYSTSETEEEYQAYLKCKPKWHGKGGHKDSWDPLQIQSPPQITQKPVGVIQKPKPQPAGQVSQSIERGIQIGATPIYVPSQSFPEHHRLPPTSNLPPLPDRPKPTTNTDFQPVQSHPNLIKKSDSIIEVRQPLPMHQKPVETSFPTVAHMSREPVQPTLFEPVAQKPIMQKPIEPLQLKPVEVLAPIEPLKPVMHQNDLPSHPLPNTFDSKLASSEQQSDFKKELIPRKIEIPDQKLAALPVINSNPLQENNHAKQQSDMLQQNNGNETRHSPPPSPISISQSSDVSKERSPMMSQSSNDKLEDASGLDDGKQPKRTTAQQRLQQKLMTEALQKVEFKKERAKQFSNTTTRPNPTITAMEIMTRKELKAGEMEQRLARGEIPDIPIPSTPEHLKKDDIAVQNRKSQQSFLDNIAAQRASRASPQIFDLRKSESMKIDKPVLSPKPSFHKRLSEENVGNTAPIILLKKQPKRLDPEEIKVRTASLEKLREAKLSSPSPKPVEVAKAMPIKSQTQNLDMEEAGSKASPKKSLSKVVSEPAQKLGSPKLPTKQPEKVSPQVQAAAKTAALASIVPKTSPAPKQGLSKAEIAYQQLKQEKLMRIEAQRETLEIPTAPSEGIKKATEVYEKNLNEKPVKRFDSSKKALQQSRSKSIGSNLAMKLQMAAAFEDESSSKTTLPWAQGQNANKHVNPGIRKHIASRDKQGYALRMSKSSDSITAAKLLAESRAREGNANLRINQDMSKSIERQLDVYTKTREDIRKILEVAKACSVQDRIKLFNRQSPFENFPREDKAEAIRREIQELKANKDTKQESDGGRSSADIQIQSPVEVKVKPLRIPMKPKIVETESVNKDVRSEPGSKLRINQPLNAKSPEVKSILRTSTSLERNRKVSADAVMMTSATSSNHVSKAEQPKQPKSILVKKKIPKLVHSINEGSNGPTIYTQSATDISDEDSERHRRHNIPLTINTKAQFLEVPHESTGLRKSKSFASPGQYECAMKDSEISAKQKTIMAFFDASLNPEMKSPSFPLASSQVQVKKSTEMAAVVKRSSAGAIHQKRGSIASISDEILGDDDLKDVDAVFESLLNSTFQEKQARGREMSSSRGGSKKRSVSSHPTTRSDLGNASRSAEVKGSSGPKRSSGGSVNRKQSKNKLAGAGEVIVNSDPNNIEMPNKEVLADPIGALPTSHTKKYLPRQQTWSPPTPAAPAVQTPSPTQSEYDTCPDPWEDY